MGKFFAERVIIQAQTFQNNRTVINSTAGADLFFAIDNDLVLRKMTYHQNVQIFLHLIKPPIYFYGIGVVYLIPS